MTEVNTAEIAVVDLEGNDLYREYNRLAGRRARPRGAARSEARIRKEIQTMRDQRAESQARADAQAAAEAALKAERQALVDARGTFEEFAAKAYGGNLEGDEQKLAYLARRTKDAEDAYLAELAEFTEKAAKSPAYAMEWSMGLFQGAAKAEVAHLVRHIVETGMSLQDLTEILTRDVFNEASSPQRSTSVPSNLIKQEVLARKADMLRDLMGRGFY